MLGDKQGVLRHWLELSLIDSSSPSGANSKPETTSIMRGQLAVTPVSGAGGEITGVLFSWGFVLRLRDAGAGRGGAAAVRSGPCARALCDSCHLNKLSPAAQMVSFDMKRVCKEGRPSPRFLMTWNVSSEGSVQKKKKKDGGGERERRGAAGLRAARPAPSPLPLCPPLPLRPRCRRRWPSLPRGPRGFQDSV